MLGNVVWHELKDWTLRDLRNQNLWFYGCESVDADLRETLKWQPDTVPTFPYCSGGCYNSSVPGPSILMKWLWSCIKMNGAAVWVTDRLSWVVCVDGEVWLQKKWIKVSSSYQTDTGDGERERKWHGVWAADCDRKQFDRWNAHADLYW